MSDRVRVVVAGAGAFGREHIRLLATMADAEIVGIADVNAAAAETAARQAGVATAGTDAVALIDRLRPDGLIVATPGPTHVALARHALAAGIPVLVEKPVAMTAAEASALAEAEKRSDGFVLPGHVLRFSKSHRRLVEIAQSTEVGSILSVTARRHRDDSHAVRYREDPILMTMIHDIDLALWISGASPQTVSAIRRPSGTSRSLTLATMSADAGPVWQLATAWTFPTEASSPPDRIEVIGERGSVELQADGALNVYGDNTRRMNVPTDLDEALRNEHACFVACIRSRTGPTVVTLADAVAGLAVADAVQASLAAYSGPIPTFANPQRHPPEQMSES